MSRIEKVFQEAKENNRPVVIPYLTAGFPSMEVSKKLFQALAQGGADIIEIGLPFSDPLADGPTIQKSSQVALDQGITTESVFRMVKELRKTITIPLIIMTYYNLFFRYGLENFAKDAKEAGVDGVIIPDLPPEEAEKWLLASQDKLDTVFLLAPTSTKERIEKIASLSQSFIYCVSLTGVTGARVALAGTLPEFIARVRERTKKPLAVGFGISTVEQGQQVANLAEGIIIGSALIKIIDGSPSINEAIKKVKTFIGDMRCLSRNFSPEEAGTIN